MNAGAVRPQRPKDNNAPRRPPSAYYMFIQEVRTDVVMDMQVNGVEPSRSKVSKEIGRRYRELPEWKKEVYKKNAANEMKRYQDAIAAYPRTRDWQKHQDAMEVYRKQIRNFRREAAELTIVEEKERGRS